MILLFDLAIYVLSGIAFFKLAKKASLDNIAWFAWVPVLNTILLLRMIGKSGWNILLLLIPIANAVFAVVWYVKFFHAFGKSGHWTWMMLFLPPVMYILLIVWFSDGKLVYNPPVSRTA